MGQSVDYFETNTDLHWLFQPRLALVLVKHQLFFLALYCFCSKSIEPSLSCDDLSEQLHSRTVFVREKILLVFAVLWVFVVVGDQLIELSACLLNGEAQLSEMCRPPK